MTSVLLLATNDQAAEGLVEDLTSAGIDVRATSDCSNVLHQVITLQPDLLVCVVPTLGNALFDDLASVATSAPRPVAMFTNDPDVDKMALAARSGVHAYVVSGYSRSRVRSVIHLAQARFRQEQLIQQELAELRTRFEERKLVDRAKGILMGARQLREEEAFRALRTAAMASKQRIGQISNIVIESARYAEAINRAGQLRMLSQRLVKLYALICLGIDRDASQSLFSQSTEQAEAILSFLNRTLSKPTFGDLLDAVAKPWTKLQAVINRPRSLAHLGEVDRLAEQLLERAVNRDPTHVEARTTLGIVRLRAGRLPAALDDLRAAVALAPEHADAHSNLGHALFASGDWEAAWPHFEYRFRRAAQRDKLSPPAGVGRWDGKLSTHLELWLIGEQGLGDQLQFARYGTLLAERGIRCVIVCHPRLVGILSLAGLGARIVPHGTAAGGAAAAAARWFPLMSLPAWHRTRADTVPAAGGYLAADPERIARWGKRLPIGCWRVALAWAGNPSVETGPYAGRSPPLAALEPLMTVSNVRFLSLQQGVGAEALAAVDFGRRIECFEDLDAGPHAFLDTAAVLKSVDLLITSDTAIAHLAGGLGVQTWLCLMHEPDWRWMRRGDTTPWYSSMRLFRQASPGDWLSVYREVATRLGMLVLSEGSAHHE